jgi:uncharacterized protein (DUF952 family)
LAIAVTAAMGILRPMPTDTETSRHIYRICPRPVWAAARQAGRFDGTEVDIRDGFIHFSAPGQVAETAAKHYAGQTDLVLLRVDSTRLGDALTWEVSRGGALFPHLYAPLPVSAVEGVAPYPLGDDGVHQPPAMLRADLDESGPDDTGPGDTGPRDTGPGQAGG